jgi:hypothetical protein
VRGDRDPDGSVDRQDFRVMGTFFEGKAVLVGLAARQERAEVESDVTCPF